VIDPAKLSGAIKFGATVTLVDEDTDEEKTYQIVGEPEASIETGLLNIKSPIARALIGKEEGDSVEVRTPGGHCTAICGRRPQALRATLDALRRRSPGARPQRRLQQPSAHVGSQPDMGRRKGTRPGTPADPAPYGDEDTDQGILDLAPAADQPHHAPIPIVQC
jgi:hypothetical protein